MDIIRHFIMIVNIISLAVVKKQQQENNPKNLIVISEQHNDFLPEIFASHKP